MDRQDLHKGEEKEEKILQASISLLPSTNRGEMTLHEQNRPVEQIAYPSLCQRWDRNAEWVGSAFSSKSSLGSQCTNLYGCCRGASSR